MKPRFIRYTSTLSTPDGFELEFDLMATGPAEARSEMQRIAKFMCKSGEWSPLVVIPVNAPAPVAIKEQENRQRSARHA